MTDEPKLVVTTDAFGHPTVRVTGKGYIVTEDEAESIVKLVADLRELCADLHYLSCISDRDSEACMCMCERLADGKCFAEDGCYYEQRMDELGVPR